MNFVNPAVQCNCQSLGQFFELATIQPPVEVVAVEPYPPTCP